MADFPLVRRSEAKPLRSFPGRRLARIAVHNHIRAMITRAQWRRFVDHPVVEWTMFVVGVLLIIAAFAVGWLPGPGGVFFGVPGLILILKSSTWARRHYVKVKRWEGAHAPKVFKWRVTPGRWADLALRRRSALRRERLRKEREQLAKAEQSGPSN